MAATKLSDKEISAELKKLNGWRVMNGNLHRVFEFKDFSEAFGFMTRAALAAEKLTALLAKQLPDSEKRARADFVVDTSQDFDSTRARIRAILAAAETLPIRRT